MSRQHLTDDELLLFICGDVDATERVGIAKALSNDPLMSRRAAAWSKALRFLNDYDVACSDQWLERLYEKLAGSHMDPPADKDSQGTTRSATRHVDDCMSIESELLPRRANDKPCNDPSRINGELTSALHALFDDSTEVSDGFQQRLKQRLDREDDQTLVRIPTAQDSSMRRTGGRLRRRSFGLAAAICVISVVAWLAAIVMNPQPTFGLSDLRERLNGIHSIHVKGWVYHRNRENSEAPVSKQPVEWYVQRPHFYWYRLTPSNVNGYVVGNDRQSLRVNHDRYRCDLIELHPFGATFHTEVLLNGLFTDLAGQWGHSYRKTDLDEINGVSTAVYERISANASGFKCRTVIWIDGNGLPVKSQTYYQTDSQAEYLHLDLNHIEIDQPPPNPEMFSFEPPQGYTVTRQEQSVDEIFTVSSKPTSTEEVVIRFAFNISDRALLVCWGYRHDEVNDDSQSDTFSMSTLRMSASVSTDSETLQLKPVLLRTDTTSKYDWHWELFVADHHALIPTDAAAIFVFQTAKQKLNLVVLPLDFARRADLADMIRNAQALTPESGWTPAQSITLDAIEAQLEQLR